jgi:hypothetical protein
VGRFVSEFDAKGNGRPLSFEIDIPV